MVYSESGVLVIETKHDLELSWDLMLATVCRELIESLRGS